VSDGSRVISIVMPCHNASTFIAQTVFTIASELRENEELIIVENGSTDSTYTVLERMLLASPNSQIVLVQSNKGIGFALRSGINVAEGDFIVFMADDLPFGTQELRNARAAKTSGMYEYNILSKYLGSIPGISLRKIQGWIFIFLRELIFPLKVRDSQATFFGKKAIIKKLSNLSVEEGFLVTTELIALARKLNLRINEIPCEVLISAPRKSTIRFNDILRMLKGLFKLRQRVRQLVV